MTWSQVGWALLHFGWQALVVGASLASCLRATDSPSRRGTRAFLALLVLAALPLIDLLVIGLRSAPVVTAAAGAGPVLLGLAPAYAAVGPATRLIALVWVALATLLVARWAGGWWTLRRLVGRATPARIEWCAMLDSAARRSGVRRRVAILESESIGVPTLVGVRRPAIVIPPSTCAGLSPLEMEAVLAHELAHVRRRDALANLAQSLIEALLFFHPVVWWASRRLREEREASCDDLAAHAMGDQRLYARALARLAVLRAGRPRLALAASDGALVARLERLLDPRAGRGSRHASVALVTSSAVGLILLIALSATLLPGTLRARPAARPAWFVVHATDPAGSFTLRVEQGRVVRAVVSGAAVPAERIVQHGDSVVLPWAGGHFALRLNPSGGFSWTARTP